MFGYYDMAVIGLRNELFQDDSFGIRVARRLKELNIEPIDVIEAAEGELAEHLARYRTAIVVYSFHDSDNGEVVEMDLGVGREKVTSLPRGGQSSLMPCSTGKRARRRCRNSSRCTAYPRPRFPRSGDGGRRQRESESVRWSIESCMPWE